MGMEKVNLLLRTHDMIQDLKWSAELREQLLRDEKSVFDRYQLLPEERAALERRDFKALTDLGVHPYLLSQLARLFYGTREENGQSVAAVALLKSLLRQD